MRWWKSIAKEIRSRLRSQRRSDDLRQPRIFFESLVKRMLLASVPDGQILLTSFVTDTSKSGAPDRRNDTGQTAIGSRPEQNRSSERSEVTPTPAPSSPWWLFS